MAKNKAGKWAEKDSELPKLAARAERYLMTVWSRAQDELLRIVGLDTLSASAGELFNYIHSADMQMQLDSLLENTVYLAGAADGALVGALVLAHERGLKNATKELNQPATAGILNPAQTDVLQRRQAALRTHALEQATNSTTLSLKDRIYAELIAGDYNNMDPKTVAQRLKQRFDDRAINYRQIAHAEVARAHADGKLDQYGALGIEQYDYVYTNDSKTSTICRRHGNAGPYQVGKGPLPVRDSHPECRCTIKPRV